MVFLIPVREDPSDPQPREIYNWRVVAVALAAAWGSSMFGYDSAFIGGTMALPSFQSAWGLADASDASHTALSAHIVSTFQAGCFFGALLVYFTNDRLGRKPSLIGAGVIFNIGVILQLIGGGSIGLFYAGRALTGLGVGSSSVVIPQYIAECAPAAIRGALVGLFEIMLQLSAVCGYWVNYGVNRNISGTNSAQWRIPVGVQLVPGTLLILGMLWAVESPRHSVAKGLHQKAIKDLQWLRNLPADHPHIRIMISNIQNQLEHEGVSSTQGGGNFRSVIRETFSSAVLPRLMIGIWIQLFQNFTGINGINYFSPTIFKSIGFTGTSVGLLATGVYGAIKSIFSIISFMFLVDRFGRRPLLLLASIGCCFTLFYLAGYASLTHSFEGDAEKNAAAYSAIVMVYLFAISYVSGWNLSWIVCSELFPTHVRSFCLTITTCSQWLGQFIVVYSTPYMIEGISYGVFIFFGCMTAIAFAFVYFFVPETKGVALEDMDILFRETTGFASKKRKQFDEIVTLRNRERAANKLDGEEAQHVENLDKVA
ncbi:MFS quinate transporter QutD [Ilyonectria destructans]|nr:MFS quinate transporter QutD [Ilyonectria destructans]